MAYRYAILGSGRQGTAAAYDFHRFGEAEVIFMTDVDLPRARSAAGRVNKLAGAEVAEPIGLDATDSGRVAEFLRSRSVDAFLSAVPYFMNLGLTQASIQAGSGMTDLGGNSDIVFQQLDQTAEAAAAGISIVPDCGQVPGMGTSLVLFAMEQLDEATDVYMWDCGLPSRPEPPWNYKLTFNIEGLTNEYTGDCMFIRQGKLARVPALEELEEIAFPEPIGRLEAFTTSGGLTSAARTFAGKLQTLQNKTLRYPGNHAHLTVMRQLGLFGLAPIEVDGGPVVPRHLLHALWEPQIRAAEVIDDFILIRVLARGIKDGRAAEAQIDLIHRADAETGFTAMEQATGWHAAIMTEAIARGEVERGVIPVERAMSGTAFVRQAAMRGFEVERQVRFISEEPAAP
jgi:lysine 6-dehydrogenase